MFCRAEKGTMYGVCSLGLNQNFEVRPADKNFYIPLTIDKMSTCCSATKFPGMIYYKNQKLKWKVKSQKWKSYNVLFEEKEDGGVGEGKMRCYWM